MRNFCKCWHVCIMIVSMLAMCYLAGSCLNGNKERDVSIPWLASTLMLLLGSTLRAVGRPECGVSMRV